MQKMSMNGVIIRQVTKEDLSGLEWEGAYTHFRRLYQEAYQQATRGEAVLWVADAPEIGLVGQLFVHLERQGRDRALGEPYAYLYGFRVRPEFRRRGIGTQLIKAAEEDLIRRGYRIARLNVGMNNPDARRLYERLGYSIIGTDPGRWSYVDERGRLREVHEPAWKMEKALG